MTNHFTTSQFLDDVERRGVNGDTFTVNEINRLLILVGRRPVMEHPVYLRGSARKYVQMARANITQQVKDRLTVKGVEDAETTYY